MGSYTKRKLLLLEDHLFQDSSLLRRDENRKGYSCIPLKVHIFFKYKYGFYMYVNYILLDPFAYQQEAFRMADIILSVTTSI